MRSQDRANGADLKSSNFSASGLQKPYGPAQLLAGRPLKKAIEIGFASIGDALAFSKEVGQCLALPWFSLFWLRFHS
jgi:hypothetical protein